MRLGVICPSEIAYRRFMPSLRISSEFEYVGVGMYSIEERFGNNIEPEDKYVAETMKREYKKAQQFEKEYGGKIFEGYRSIVESDEIDAIYIPLPPSLHYNWAKLALESGKHVLLEKPFTLSTRESKELIQLAKKKKLALHENYMFLYHKQIDEIDEIVKSGELGEVRLYRICFGFPMRSASDFRYNKELGGGALIDAGGYTIKYAARLLGENSQIKCAVLNYSDKFEVDLYGSGMLVNDNNVVAQIAFGMDNNYKCELEIWGSKGTLTTGRVLTAPTGYQPTAMIKIGNYIEERALSEDDSFAKSINHFAQCISDKDVRYKNYDSILGQVKLVDDFKKIANESIRE